MVAVNDLGLEHIEVVRYQARLGDANREITAVEVLNRGNSQHVFGRFFGTFKLGRDDSYVVSAAAEFLFVVADRTSHTSRMRKVGVGKHSDSQDGDPSSRIFLGGSENGAEEISALAAV